MSLERPSVDKGLVLRFVTLEGGGSSKRLNLVRHSGSLWVCALEKDCEAPVPSTLFALCHHKVSSLLCHVLPS